MFSYIQFINDFVKKTGLRVSFIEFYIEDKFKKVTQNPLIRFLRPIFHKKAEVKHVSQHESIFMRTVTNLKNSLEHKYNKKTRIFIGKESKSPLKHRTHDVVPMHEGKHFKTYYLREKLGKDYYFIDNKDLKSFVDYEFPKTEQDVYYSMKSKKRRRKVHKLRSLMTANMENTGYRRLKKEITETNHTDYRHSTPVKTSNFISVFTKKEMKSRTAVKVGRKRKTRNPSWLDIQDEAQIREGEFFKTVCNNFVKKY